MNIVRKYIGYLKYRPTLYTPFNTLYISPIVQYIAIRYNLFRFHPMVSLLKTFPLSNTSPKSPRSPGPVMLMGSLHQPKCHTIWASVSTIGSSDSEIFCFNYRGKMTEWELPQNLSSPNRVCTVSVWRPTAAQYKASNLTCLQGGIKQWWWGNPGTSRSPF